MFSKLNINKKMGDESWRALMLMGFVGIAALIGYLIMAISSADPFYNIENGLILLLAICMLMVGFADFFSNGLKIGNALLISFYFFLAFNCFGLSLLQKPKTFQDMYYYFVGPLLFYGALNLFEKVHICIKRKTLKINLDWINAAMLLLFCGLCLYVFAMKGIRLFSTALKSQQASLYVVPGISGLIDVLGWLLLMMSVNTKNKYLKPLMMVMPVLFALLNASRTLTMRMGAFVVCAFMCAQGKKVASLKFISLILAVAIIVVVVFGIWGNYRESVSGWMNVSIGTALESKVDNDIINWLYGYSAINYDVLKQKIIEKEYPLQFKHLLVPVIRVFGGSEAVAQYNKEVSNAIGKSLNGFNAMTFLAMPIMEMGAFYFVELLLLALIIGICIVLGKAFNFRGGYIYFTMASIMSVFGDYYIDINGDYALILGLLICAVVSNGMADTEEKKQNHL